MLPFGQALLLWRLERGLTQEELARSAGIPRPNLSAIERGRREVQLRTLRALAAALKVAPGILADGEAPSLGKALPLSRSAMERIAESVIRGGRPRGEKERRLALLLREVHSRAALGRKRKTDAAWLRLSAEVPSATLRSLLQRVRDRMGRG